MKPYDKEQTIYMYINIDDSYVPLSFRNVNINEIHSREKKLNQFQLECIFCVVFFSYSLSLYLPAGHLL